MKAGIILGLLTSPLMASTNGYDLIIRCLNYETAVENGITWNYIAEEESVPLDSNCYYMTFAPTNNNEKYVYYQYALGEEWYQWTEYNQSNDIPGVSKPQDNQDGISTYGFCYNLSTIRELTQASIDKAQMDIIFNLMYGSIFLQKNTTFKFYYGLYDFTDYKYLQYGQLFDFNPYGEIIDGNSLNNIGINWIVGSVDYVIRDEATPTEIYKNYRALGISIDLTSILISRNIFNDFNNLIVNNQEHYIGIILDCYDLYDTSYPNLEHNTYTSVYARIGWGQNLENTRYTDGYNTGYNNGYNTGYQQGYDNAPKTNTESTVQSLLGALFGSLKDLLDVELLPGISVGTILGIPIVLTIITWVIHWIRG